MWFLIVFSLYIALVYPIFLSLFGLEWVSSDESPLYTYCVLGINAIVIGYVVIKELINFRKAKGSMLPYCIPLIVGFIYGVEQTFVFYPTRMLADKSFIFFFAFSLGAIYSGTYCYRYNKLDLLVKNLELFMLICTVALISALPHLAASTSQVVRIGGGNHQAISYSSALAFGVIYCSIRKTNDFKRYTLFKLKIYPYVATVFLILLSITCLIGGGRGGAVLLIVNFLLCTFTIAKNNIKQIFGCLLLVSALILLLSQFSFGSLETLLDKGIDRCFAFITDEGVDMSNGSSGRDRVYEKSLELFFSHPFFGYGFFTQYDLCEKTFHQPYAHNLFLEVLLQFGIVGFSLLMYLLVGFLKKVKILIRKGGKYTYLLPLSTLPLVMLMFSGTYVFTPSFWFIMIFVFGYTSIHSSLQKTKITTCRNSA